MCKWLDKLLGREKSVVSLPITPTRWPAEPRMPTLELVSLPGHGKTSYIWSLLYMLRKMDLLWPGYVCWAQDDATEAAFKSIHHAMHGRELPPTTADAEEKRFHVLLRRIEIYGDRRLVIPDRRDGVFSPPVEKSDSASAFNWSAPICWLLSLPDLAGVEAEYLDLMLDELIRARSRSGLSQTSSPLKLIVALTKADRIAELPFALRSELKGDPLWRVLDNQHRTFASSKDTGQPEAQWSAAALQGYLGRLKTIDATLKAWFGTTLPGRLFVQRAAAHFIDVRFCMVSATGSDPLAKTGLGVPWAPRRVLDPFFFLLDFEGFPERQASA